MTAAIFILPWFGCCREVECTTIILPENAPSTRSDRLLLIGADRVADAGGQKKSGRYLAIQVPSVWLGAREVRCSVSRPAHFQTLQASARQLTRREKNRAALFAFLEFAADFGFRDFPAANHMTTVVNTPTILP